MQSPRIFLSLAAALVLSGGADMLRFSMSAAREPDLLLGANPWQTSKSDVCATRPALARPPLPFTPPQETMHFTVEGKITQHIGQKLTINTESNIIFYVVYNDNTAITRKDGSAGTAKDLQVGTRIHVDGELTEAGEIIAQKISIQSGPAGEKR